MRAALLSAALFLLAGCGGPAGVDLNAEREKVLEADRQFAVETLERGGDGWADYFAEDAIMFPASGRIVGQDSIRATMTRVMTPDAPKLLWEPESAVIGKGGDLAFTIGRWQSVAEAHGEKTVLAQGNYLTVWRKEPDGEWKVITDMGNMDQPQSPPSSPPGQ